MRALKYTQHTHEHTPATHTHMLLSGILLLTHFDAATKRGAHFSLIWQK